MFYWASNKSMQKKIHYWITEGKYKLILSIENWWGELDNQLISLLCEYNNSFQNNHMWNHHIYMKIHISLQLQLQYIILTARLYVTIICKFKRRGEAFFKIEM